jgi:ubiquinone/menaquinone biosynthesis C-methylase UbiE
MTTTDTPTSDQAIPDLAAITTRQQTAWSSGNFAVIGTTLQASGEWLAEAADVVAGSRVLDVAAGNGNATLAAARRGGVVTAIDFVPELLAGAEARAAADGLEITTRTADAQDLPFPDRSFDLVLSVFGVMFVPDPRTAAAELVRVCRPGGRVGLASWTSTSYVAEMFRVISRHVPPPAGLPSVFDWGNPELLAELLGERMTPVSVQKRDFVFRYRSAEDFVETFRTYYGPTNRAFAALDAGGQDALEHDLLELARSWNTSEHGALAIPGEYLEAVYEAA